MRSPGLFAKRSLFATFALVLATALGFPLLGCMREKPAHVSGPTEADLRAMYENADPVQLIRQDDATGLKWKLNNQSLDLKTTHDGLTLLMIAARVGAANAAAALLENGAEVDAVCASDVDADWNYEKFASFFEPFKKVRSLGYTALIWALRNGHDTIADTLIAHKANVNVTAARGQTPLTEAAKWGHARQIAVLAKAGAKINETGEDGWAPVHWMLYRDKFDALNELLRLSPDLNVRTEAGETPLHFAARLGLGKAVGFLIEKGADLRLTGANQKTALQVAIENEYFAIAERLARGGVPVNVKDTRGLTALHALAENTPDEGPLPPLAPLLVQLGSDVNARDKNDHTILMTAVLETKADMVDFLLANGANPKLTIGLLLRKQTALDLSLQELRTIQKAISQTSPSGDMADAIKRRDRLERIVASLQAVLR